MDQIKIGKFIAECRKAKRITQSELAEKLNITDKAVSKWETGKGMPDVSIMLELCDILDISTNELLMGNYIPKNSIMEETDKNIISILKEYKRMKKRKNIIKTILIIFIIVMVLSIIFFQWFNYYKTHNYSKIEMTETEESLYEKCLDYFIDRQYPNIFHIKNKNDKINYNISISDFKVFTKMQKIGMIKNGDNTEIYVIIIHKSYHIENNKKLVLDNGGMSSIKFILKDGEIINYIEFIKDIEFKDALPSEEMYMEYKKCRENDSKLSKEIDNEVKEYYAYFKQDSNDILINIDIDGNNIINTI